MRGEPGASAVPFEPRVTPWRISPADFPREAGIREALRFVIGYAVLAPSSHNTQPWKFTVGAREVRIHTDRSRWLRVADPDRREMFLSLGCALENLLIALEHFGYGHRVEYLPDGDEADTAACVTVLPGGTPSPHRPAWFFGEITARHTSHRLEDPRPIPSDQQRRLEECCMGENVRLHLVADRSHMRQVEALLLQADAAQFARSEFREELAHWIGQGVFGTPWLLDKLGVLAAAHRDGAGPGDGGEERPLGVAPLLGIVATREDDRRAQILAGQAFERIYLTASAQGIGLQPMSPVVQVRETRLALRPLLRDPGAWPQQPFRLGYAARERQHTPRRPTHEVLVETA